MKIVFTFLILIALTLISSCQLIFAFREPSPDRFSYFLKKNSVQSEKLIYEGIYYLTIQDFSELKTNYELFSFKFQREGSANLITSGPIRSLKFSEAMNLTKEWMKEQKKRNNKYGKGYYYIKNDSLHIEIATGSPGTGYYFIYFEGKILNNHKITIKQVNKIKRFRIAMKQDKEDMIDSALAIPQEFQFSPF